MKINLLTNKISDSIMEERKFLAALHGRKMKDVPKPEEYEVDEDKKEILDNLAKKQFEQWPTIKT